MARNEAFFNSFLGKKLAAAVAGKSGAA